MANIIRKSDGVTLITIPDGRIGNYGTPLQLAGRNVPDYGTSLYQNMLRITENFASPTPPENNPVVGGRVDGQFWYDTNNRLVSYYNGQQWSALADMATITDDEFTVASALRFANPLTLILTNDVSGTVTFSGDNFVALDPQQPNELTNAVQMNVTINEVDTSKLVGDINADTAVKLKTPRKIDIAGVVSGSADFDGSGDIRISTSGNVNTTVTLTGDVTGSATITNFGNVSMSTTVNSYDHDHDDEYYTKSQVDDLISNIDVGGDEVDLSGLVTLNTKQSISGEKEFTSEVQLRGGVVVHDEGTNPMIKFTRQSSETLVGVIDSVPGAVLRFGMSNNKYLVINNNGNSTFNGRVSAERFTVSSDIELKEDVLSHEVSSDFLDLQLKSWLWNDKLARNGAYITERESGIIAQEVEAISGLEGCVYTQENGYKAVDYGKLALHLILALKEEIKKK